MNDTANNEGLSPTEAAVASAWRATLGQVQISQNSNFFDLGGESLLTIDMLTHLRGTISNDIDPGLPYQDATLSGFSGAMDRLYFKKKEQSLEQGLL